ncbi:MAG TPA: SDR family oxidoreductase [Acidimicrobiales bacterium]|nr:SDR family oxidoreductase [Acidimicrobiales bacterium]
MPSNTALVTGASRGIGKACAVALAGAGFDVAIAARTVRTGEAREHSVTVRKSDMRPLPGSLEETAELVEAQGQRALLVPMDLVDRASVGAGVATVLERWGGVDLVLHNGRYVGPGLMDGILDTPFEAFEKFLEAHVLAQLVITRMVLPGMLERRSGVIMTMGSGAAYIDPPAPPGQGGWGLGYAIGKAAGHRLVGHVKAEFGSRGIRSFNINPGYVRTERNSLTAEDDGMDPSLGAPPEAIGAVVAWLATSPDAAALDGANVDAQDFCRAKELYDW